MSKLILSYLFKTSLAEFRAAILDDDTDKICRILDIERDCLNKQIDSDGNTPLLLAVEYGTPLTVRLLLEQGALPDQTNGINFQTPLVLIASKVYDDYSSYKAQRSLEMAKILIDHGAYVDKPAPYTYKDENNIDYVGKETSLMTAVRKKNLPLASLLIERKANVNYVERHSKMRPIHCAIANGDEAMFDLLENAGAICCSLMTNGENSLLHWFCYKKENDEHILLLNKLIDKGCDINAQNYDGETPLMLAAICDMTNTCRILLKNGAIVNKCDNHGNQAIDLSVPGSDCSRLFLQETNNNNNNNNNKTELNIQNYASNEPSKTTVWRRRIHRERRFTIEVGNVTNDETQLQSTPTTSINEEENRNATQLQSAPPTSINKEENKNATFSRYFFPLRRTNSEETNTKYERIWKKLSSTSQRQHGSKKLSKQRTSSASLEDKSQS
ncbi:unnamed protein product [Rotaria magnacalcarata]|uniref:Uncharacterized protein n=1 Tax=Rotaria magnacalcarata TaxID=392030 RepID=A0A819QIK0_9BILA|nr:unnamed protein product [Rotaria magnacalcarata]CAF4032321.1 unnamed protein product [Rotaria magnacalcarata]